MSFTVDETTYRQQDLLVAKQSGTYAQSEGNIALHFNHACGAVRFSLSKTSGLANYTVRVKSVKICNIPCSGTYCFDNDTWSIDQSNGKKNFTILSYSDNSHMEVTETGQFLSSDNDYLFLLPQTLTPWDRSAPLSNAYVEIECKISKDGEYKVDSANEWREAYLPLPITITQGSINPVNISMGTALRNAQGGKFSF